MYGLIDTEFVQVLKDLERMRNWDTAEGVWLDYIGRRLGFTRPTINVMVTRFGFEGSSGVGFNQAPFATATGFVPQVAVGDPIYLLCLQGMGRHDTHQRLHPRHEHSGASLVPCCLLHGRNGQHHCAGNGCQRNAADHGAGHPDGGGRLAPACGRGTDGYVVAYTLI